MNVLEIYKAKIFIIFIFLILLLIINCKSSYFFPSLVSHSKKPASYSIRLFLNDIQIVVFNSQQLDNLNDNFFYENNKVKWNGITFKKLEQILKIPEKYNLIKIVQGFKISSFLSSEFYKSDKVLLASSTEEQSSFLFDYFRNTSQIKKSYLAFRLLYPKKYKPGLQKKSDLNLHTNNITEIHWYVEEEYWKKIDLSPQVGETKNSFKNILRSVCLRCHSINGRGGGIVSDFTFPLPVSKYYDEETFVKYTMNADFRGKESLMFLTRDIPEQAVRDIYNWIKKK